MASPEEPSFVFSAPETSRALGGKGPPSNLLHGGEQKIHRLRCPPHSYLFHPLSRSLDLRQKGGRDAQLPGLVRWVSTTSAWTVAGDLDAAKTTEKEFKSCPGKKSFTALPWESSW